MYLVRIQIEVPDVLVSGYLYRYDTIRCSTVVGSDEGTKVARLTSGTWGSELDAYSKPVSGGDGISFELRSQFDAKRGFVLKEGRIILTAYNWKFLECPGSRKMLVAKLCKPVIRRYEKIVAGDVVVFLEGWPMAVYVQRKHIPLLLGDGIKRPPGLQRTKMD